MNQNYVNTPEKFVDTDEETKRQVEDERLRYQTIQKILSTFKFLK